VINTSVHIRANGPFSAVRPGDLPPYRQDEVDSPSPEPVDELIPGTATAESAGSRAGLNAQAMAGHSRRSAGAALAAFPQIVHVLANPELHLGQQLAEETGLPLVSLAETAVDELEDLLVDERYAEGFILEGIPADRAAAQSLDGLLSATDANGRRVLGWESESKAQQEIMDHYIDQGLLWVVPSPQSHSTPEQMKSTLLECLTGLPALE
jgi:hypothetical protein